MLRLSIFLFLLRTENFLRLAWHDNLNSYRRKLFYYPHVVVVVLCCAYKVLENRSNCRELLKMETKQIEIATGIEVDLGISK